MANHAVVIGIDRYATDLTSLDGPVADAHAFATWLLDSQEVAPADLRLGLLPGAFSPAAPASLSGCTTIGTTVSALNKVLLGLLNDPPADLERLYFFFSGHGAASSNPAYPQEAICLEGYTDEDTNNALEVSSLMSVLNAIPAVERFVLIDGCRNKVFADDVLFGTLSKQPRPAAGQRRNYVLRATGPGRKAAEIDGRGLFSRHLCDGLQGQGSAKRWDPAAGEGEDGEGGYVVRWDTLTQYVAEKVSATRAAQRHEQLTFVEGEHPADADPVLASFPPTHFGHALVKVRLADPSVPPASTLIVLRRNDSTEPDRRQEMTAAGSAEFEVPPSVWILGAQVDGWTANPKSTRVPVYEDQVEADVRLKRHEPIRQGTSLQSPGVAPQNRPPTQPAPTGRLRLRLGGMALSQVRPAVRVSVRKESGECVADLVTGDELSLASGAYRVRLDLPGGESSETEVLLTPDDDEVSDLAMPDTATAALARTLMAARKPLPVGGFAVPSEAMGPLASTSVATLGAIAIVQAANGGSGGLTNLGIGRTWMDTAGAIGVEAMIADEREAIDPHETHAPRARLWRTHSHDPMPFVGELRPSNAPAIESCGIVVEAGAWWLQLRDQNRQRRAGFKLATQVLPGHVTLVIRHQLASGRVNLHQYAVQRDAPDRLSIQRSLVTAEAFQRARAAGRDVVVDPAVRSLASGEWFEAFSAMVAASALLERGDAGAALFEQVLQQLLAHDIRSVDVKVLQAAQASRQGQDDLAAALLRDALGLGQAPIVDALLERFDHEIRRLALGDSESTRWIARKLAQTVNHPLWTLRREDDRRPSAEPDAAG